MSEPRDDCERFERIMQDDWVEATAAPSDADRAFAEQHRAHCHACRAVEQSFELLDGAGGEPLSNEEQERASALVDAFERTETRTQQGAKVVIHGGEARRRARAPARLWALGTLAAAAIALIVMMVQQPKQEATRQTAADRPLSMQCLLRPAGKVSSKLTEGDAFEATGGTWVWQVGSDLLLKAGSGARMQVGRARHDGVQVHLTGGWIAASLRPRRARAPLVVTTPHGHVNVTGTVFAVQVQERETSVFVQRGVVEVQTARRAQGLKVRSGEQHTIGASDNKPLVDEWRTRLSVLQASGRVLSVQNGASMEVRTQPEGATLVLDGVRLGQAPVLVRVPAGRHELGAEERGFSSAARSLTLRQGERRKEHLKLIPQSARTLEAEPAMTAQSHARNGELLPRSAEQLTTSTHRVKSAAGTRLRPDKGETARESSAPNATPPAAELLAQAQAARRGRRWTVAARLYGTLIKQYADQPEGRAALVSLAQLELGPLQQPGKALAHFERYLEQQPGGSVAQEARFGKARALRALGQSDAEARALGAFLQHHPRALQAPAARKRLEAIEAAR